MYIIRFMLVLQGKTCYGATFNSKFIMGDTKKELIINIIKYQSFF